ncbi:MAG: M20 family metallo-hydrolase [Spirochaetales bacterium]|nr:M20 family metallo-hydrolase [Spirochaetales bacterium]
MITLQKELTKVPAMAPQNGGDGEWEKSQVLMQWLDKCGIPNVERINAIDERVSSGRRPNIIATIPGESTDKTFWIMTHLDVVPPGDTKLWDSDPFTVIEKKGCLIGRGVEDNQQSLIASLYAAASILEAGFMPHYTVKLLFVADEETGSEYGIKYLLDNYKLFRKKDFILVPDGGNEQGTMIEIAEKSILWLQFRTVGRQCHASAPDHGINAFLAASELVLQLNKLNEEYKEEDPIFDPPVSTFSPTKKEANVPNVNTIPGDDIFYMDCRILPSIDLDQVLQRITEIMSHIDKKYGVQSAYTIIQRASSPATPADAPIVHTLKHAIKNIYNVEGKEKGIGGGTVAAPLRRKGYDTVVWSKIDDTAHSPNEYCVIDNMVGDSKVMADIMMKGI